MTPRIGGIVLTPPDCDGNRYTARCVANLPSGRVLVRLGEDRYRDYDPRELIVYGVYGVARAHDIAELRTVQVARMLDMPAVEREGD